MSESFWRAVSEQRYLEQTGKAELRRKQEEYYTRERDRLLREQLGDDCPSPYRDGRGQDD